MKRIISFLLILALLICLVACGNDGESSSSESQAEQSSTETQSASRESESITESETQGNTSSESAVESESQSQSTESVTESETNSESESESTTESETESEIESESSTETESEIESESESESESETQNPTTVAEWVEANSDEINTFMNANYLTTFAKKAVLIGLNESKIQNAEWIFSGDENVDSIKLKFTYKSSDTSEAVYVVSYNLAETIKGEDLLKSSLSISSSNLTKDYQFNYNPTIQGTRDELVNALFKAVGVNEVGGPRYFKDLGATAMVSGLGMANGFTVVEVGEEAVKEFTIYVNETSSDSAYISKLENPAEFKITDSKEVDISGTSVEYVAQ